LDENLATEAQGHGQQLIKFAYRFLSQLLFAEFFEKHSFLTKLRVSVKTGAALVITITHLQVV